MKSIAKMSLAELRDLSDQVARAIDAARSQEKAAAKAEIMAMLASRGLKLTDLVGMQAASAAPKVTMIPKYRDRQTGATWVGRGRMPRNFDRTRAERINA